MITVDGLLFDYPTVRALHGVSFTVETETITALVGPNGAGKTTLLRCLAALETPLSGKITVDDVDVAERPRAAHRRIGFLQDFFGLYDDLSVRRCLRHHAAAHDVPRAERPQRIAITAERLGLTERLDQKTGQLSRGFRQRVAIGQAIIHGPKVLMLDEPAAGLDPEARQELSNLLLTLRAEGMTIIVSSHILVELEDYSSHMMILDRGRVKENRAIAATTIASGRRLKAVLSAPDARLGELLAATEGVSRLAIEEQMARFDFSGDAARQALLLKILIEAGLAISHFGEERQTMQDVYLERLHAE
ncbi:MAG: ABC transporter ATP-binding protein [Proteobacteria bacterium]|nr:ABC transporter ATP-binding protein [Pseudomonadota bacterium]